MNAEELKLKLKEIFGEQIIFNKEFDYYAEAIKNIDNNLLEWCGFLKDDSSRSLRPPNLLGHRVFIKKIGSTNRCIVIKIINGEFKEIHLADHSYYDKKMQELGLKKSSKRY
ncbi:MAG: hypothetical protein ABIH82_02765 [Candidatus Woesearchaeota archaeon]